jgi:hypothetical protein
MTAALAVLLLLAPVEVTFVGSPADDTKPVVFRVSNLTDQPVTWTCTAEVQGDEGQWETWPFRLEDGAPPKSQVPHVVEPSKLIEVRWDPKRATVPDVEPRACWIRIAVTTYKDGQADETVLSDMFARTLP